MRSYFYLTISFFSGSSPEKCAPAIYKCCFCAEQKLEKAFCQAGNSKNIENNINRVTIMEAMTNRPYMDAKDLL